jgi:hypothetical protein
VFWFWQDLGLQRWLWRGGVFVPAMLLCQLWQSRHHFSSKTCKSCKLLKRFTNIRTYTSTESESLVILNCHKADISLGCILMSTNHSKRHKNTLYMYEGDLIRVWTDWGASIIT